MRKNRILMAIVSLTLMIPSSGEITATSGTPAQPDTIRFAVIGDFGNYRHTENCPRERRPVEDVANLVNRWAAGDENFFVITVGDNNYSTGSASTIDRNIGQYYHDFIHPYTGSYGSGATTNKFFPSLGNHDWGNVCQNPGGADPYLAYFTLPGNERYYDFVRGPVHLFAIDSDCNEPHGNRRNQEQARWLRGGLENSTARWKLVYFHHPPYSSGRHGSHDFMQWPFKEWRATAVLAGHDHNYERLIVGDFPYFVNGLGGQDRRPVRRCVTGSQIRYDCDFGAMLVTASPSSIKFEFITTGNQTIDSYTINSDGSTSSDVPAMPCGMTPVRCECPARILTPNRRTRRLRGPTRRKTRSKPRVRRGANQTFEPREMLSQGSFILLA